MLAFNLKHICKAEWLPQNDIYISHNNKEQIADHWGSNTWGKGAIM